VTGPDPPVTNAGKPLASVGRPRRFEPADELQRLFEAALAVMQRNGYTDAAVADILAEAGMSTRSFYRHFGSKDQLLCALYRHEAEQVAERLTARVARAASPLAALDVWIEEIMSLGYHRRKAARMAVLGSPGAMRAEGYADESPCTRCLPTASATGRSRWQTQRATRRSCSRWCGPRLGSTRSASPPDRARRRSAPRGHSAGVRSACALRHQSASVPVLGANPRLPPSPGTRPVAAA
jgi:AcrR family transcriptional regulator